MDHGYPQITDPAVLKSLIIQRGFSGDMPVLAVEMLQKVCMWAHACLWERHWAWACSPGKLGMECCLLAKGAKDLIKHVCVIGCTSGVA